MCPGPPDLAGVECGRGRRFVRKSWRVARRCLALQVTVDCLGGGSHAFAGLVLTGPAGRRVCTPAAAVRHRRRKDRHMKRFVSRLLTVVCAVISLMAFSGRAMAEVRAHSSRGTAQFVSPTDFVGEGNATHLGRYTEAGSVSFSPTSDPTVLH